MEKKKRNFKEIMENGKELISFYREHPCIAAYDLLGVDFAPIQRLVFRDMWFKNYVITVCSRGYGKSVMVSNNISILQNKGVVYLDEFLPKIPEYLKDGEEEVIDWDDEVFTTEGFRKTKKLCLEKGIEGKSIETENNLEISGSNQHPLLVLNKDCTFSYKRLDEFKPGDRVCIQKGQMYFNENNKIPEDDAYLLGIFIGGVDIEDDNKLTSSDQPVLDFCEEQCDIIEKYGVKRVAPYEREVPYLIRTSCKDSQISFLQGLFDISSIVDSITGTVSYHSVSKKLVKEIQVILLNFGIVSRIIKKKNGSKLGKSYILDIHSEYSHKFNKLIGFRLEKKKNILENYFGSKEEVENKDTVPYVLQIYKEVLNYYRDTYSEKQKPIFNINVNYTKDATYESIHDFLLQCREIEFKGFSLAGVKNSIDKLYEILKYNYYFDTVVKVEDWKGDCYDFQMDMENNIEPNYFSNGFINHNTFALGTLAALSCLLYPGYRAGLISSSFRQSFAIEDDGCGVFWTDKGMVTGAENMYKNTVPKVDKVQSRFSTNSVQEKWLNKERACIQIETTKGFKIPGSIDHSILVLKGCKELEYKELQDITEEDYIVIRKGFNLFGNETSMPEPDKYEEDPNAKDFIAPKKLTPNLAYWVGLFVSNNEGLRHGKVPIGGINFSNTDYDPLKYFREYLREYFLLDKSDSLYINFSGFFKSNSVATQNNLLTKYLIKCGFITDHLDKKIPDIIKKAPSNIFISFLQGLFDSKGEVEFDESKLGCSICFLSCYKKFMVEIQSSLLNLGIVSNLIDTGKKYKIGNEYKLEINDYENILKFYNTICFRSEKKKGELEKYLNSSSDKSISLSESLGLPDEIVNSNVGFFEELYEEGIHFVKLKGKDYFFSDTFDIEVDNEHCYWANGFINHNSKMIFSEVEKLYDASSILREATVKKPIRGTDICYLRFKSVSGKPGSYIEALPIGSDGAKVRGSRFYLIVVDELAQVQSKTLDMVIRPMGATSLAPMERVRRLEEQKRLIDAGLATAKDFKEETVNKLIMASSGYYKFNHMWKRMKDYWRTAEKSEREGKEPKHAVWQVPYWDLPEGFLDMSNIEDSKRVMTNHEFRMEYEAAMVSDSEGFFKASLLDDCTLDSGFSLNLTGGKKNHIIGVDPNQGGANSCGVIILEVGKKVNKIVNIIELKRQTTQGLTKSIQKLSTQYNTIRIFMDRGGGGKAVMDLLEEGYNDAEPILDRSNNENFGKKGRYILEMVNFNPSWISDANFTTKAMFEDKTLLFPELAPDAIDTVAIAYDAVNVLKSQLLSIVVTQTNTGLLHFDTPSKDMNKDLYSALILAAHGARMVEKELETSDEPVIYHSAGLIREHNTGSSFVSLGDSFGGPNIGDISSSNSYISNAVLESKKGFKKYLKRA